MKYVIKHPHFIDAGPTIEFAIGSFHEYVRLTTIRTSASFAIFSSSFKRANNNNDI